MKLTLPSLNLKKNGRLLGFGSSAKRDWKIIFFASVFLFIFAMGICGYVFVSADKGDTTVEKQAVVETPVNVDTLVKTTSYYMSKGVSLQTIETTKDTTSDPSL